MSKRSLHYSPMYFPIIFILLFLFTLTNFPIPIHLMDEDIYGFITTFSFPKITAKSDMYDSIISNSTLDEVHLDNLNKTVRDLSSFHSRHTESEFIDDVAYWLTEKLQNICSREVYVHNFTHIPNEEDDVDSRQDHQQEKMPIYHLKNIACEKPGSTNNTIIISAHYDSRMEDINNSHC